MALIEHIDAILDDGIVDPADVPAEFVRRLGAKRALQEVLPHVERYLSEVARKRIAERRRRSEHTVRETPGGPEPAVARWDLLEDGVWIPTSCVWVRMRDATPQQLRDRAEHYRTLAEKNLAHASWCEAVADLIEQSGGSCVADVADILPPYPSADRTLVAR